MKPFSIARKTILCIIFSHSVFCQASSHIPYVHDSSLTEEVFQKKLSPNATSLIDYFDSRSTVQNLDDIKTNCNDTCKIEQIYKMLARPLRKSEVQTILSLMNSLDLMDNLIAKHKDLFDLAINLLLFYPNENIFYPHVVSKIKPYSDEINTAAVNSEITEYLNQSDIRHSTLYIDGRKFDIHHDQKILNTNHHWLLLSNIYFPTLIFGTFEKLKNHPHSKPFLAACDDKVNLFNADEATALDAFFVRVINANENCMPRENAKLLLEMKNTYDKTNSDQAYKSWILPLTLLTGAILIAQMRNKQVSFHLPVLRF